MKLIPLLTVVVGVCLNTVNCANIMSFGFTKESGDVVKTVVEYGVGYKKSSDLVMDMDDLKNSIEEISKSNVSTSGVERERFCSETNDYKIVNQGGMSDLVVFNDLNCSRNVGGLFFKTDKGCPFSVRLSYNDSSLVNNGEISIPNVEVSKLALFDIENNIENSIAKLKSFKTDCDVGIRYNDVTKINGGKYNNTDGDIEVPRLLAKKGTNSLGRYSGFHNFACSGFCVPGITDRGFTVKEIKGYKTAPNLGSNVLKIDANKCRSFSEVNNIQPGIILIDYGTGNTGTKRDNMGQFLRNMEANNFLTDPELKKNQVFAVTIE